MLLNDLFAIQYCQEFFWPIFENNVTNSQQSLCYHCYVWVRGHVIGHSATSSVDNTARRRAFMANTARRRAFMAGQALDVSSCAITFIAI